MVCPVAPTGAVLVQQVGKEQLGVSARSFTNTSGHPHSHTHQGLDYTHNQSKSNTSSVKLPKRVADLKCRFLFTSPDKSSRKFKNPFDLEAHT